MDIAQKVLIYCENHDALVAALHRYIRAQSNMLDRWADSDEGVKQDLWRALHACEEPARAALEKAES